MYNYAEVQRYTQKKLKQAFGFVKKQLENSEISLDEFNEIVKNIRKNYTEDTETIEFELFLRHVDGDMFLDINKNDFILTGKLFSCTIHEAIDNEEAHKKLYNLLLDFCK